MYKDQVWNATLNILSLNYLFYWGDASLCSPHFLTVFLHCKQRSALFFSYPPFDNRNIHLVLPYKDHIYILSIFKSIECSFFDYSRKPNVFL